MLGLLVLAASLGPGYAYIRVAERRAPRPDRSALLEIAELVTVGGSCTAVVALFVLAGTQLTELVDLEALGRDRWEYTLEHPVRVLLLLLVVLGGSYLLAVLTALAVHRGQPASLRHHSVWHEALGRRRDGLVPFATVELRDGRMIAGPVAYYTIQEAPPDCRELVLTQKIVARSTAGTPFVRVPDDRVVLRASDISALSVTYFDPQAQSGGPTAT